MAKTIVRDAGQISAPPQEGALHSTDADAADAYAWSAPPAGEAQEGASTPKSARELTSVQVEAILDKIWVIAGTGRALAASIGEKLGRQEELAMEAYAASYLLEQIEALAVFARGRDAELALGESFMGPYWSRP
jgi:hypothetical protein